MGIWGTAGSGETRGEQAERPLQDQLINSEGRTAGLESPDGAKQGRSCWEAPLASVTRGQSRQTPTLQAEGSQLSLTQVQVLLMLPWPQRLCARQLCRNLQM